MKLFLSIWKHFLYFPALYEESSVEWPSLHCVLYESTACLQSSSPNLSPRSRAKCSSAMPDQSKSERERVVGLGCAGKQGWGVSGGRQRVCCSSLTHLHAADFHCLPTQLTITKRLCTLAAAQRSYTYCAPLSKKTCLTSLGVLPKRATVCGSRPILALPSRFVYPSLSLSVFHPPSLTSHTPSFSLILLLKHAYSS